jgi:hypothetical protein
VAELVDPVVLTPDDDTSHTRCVADVTVINNQRNPLASLKVRLRHQRRGNRGAWSDIPSFAKSRLHKAEEVAIVLSTEETLRLAELLDTHLHEMELGIPWGRERRRIVPLDALVIEGREKEALERIIGTGGRDFWDWVEELQPGRIEAVAVAREHARRGSALKQFALHLRDSDPWAERHWQEFFRANSWIFGHGLDYRFLATVQTQPNYGGAAVSGRGAQRGDELFATVGDVRFTVLVELKRPDADLVAMDPYRNSAFPPGPDVAGGVAQLQSNCRMWAQEGSRSEANARRLLHDGIETVEPKGILVVGRLSSIGDSPEKIAAFEQFRRSLHNPEIITFDELYERARYIVGSAGQSGASKTVA